MNIDQAQHQFRALLQGIDPTHLPGFLRWVKENIGEFVQCMRLNIGESPTLTGVQCNLQDNDMCNPGWQLSSEMENWKAAVMTCSDFYQFISFQLAHVACGNYRFSI